MKGWGGYAGQPGVGGGYDSQIPPGLFCYFCPSGFKVLSSKNKLNNHIVDIHKDPTSWIIWWLSRHQITCHSPPCSVCQNSITNVARTFQENPACLNTCWRSMKPAVPKGMYSVYPSAFRSYTSGAKSGWIGCPKKILQDRYLTKLMAHRRISFVIYYIAFKTRISTWRGRLDMKMSRAVLWGNSCCCCMVSVWLDKALERKRVHPCNDCDNAFKSLRTPNHHTIWQHSSLLRYV